MEAFDMQWSKGAAVIEGEVIKLFRAGTYNPFDCYYPDGQRKSLYLEFISLDETDEEAIKTFVSKYGLLGLERRKVEQKIKEGYENLLKVMTRFMLDNFLAGFRAGSTLASSSTSAEEKKAIVGNTKNLFQAAILPGEEWERKWEEGRQQLKQEAAEHAFQELQRISRGEKEETENLGEFQREICLMRGVVGLWRAYVETDINELSSNLALVWHCSTYGAEEKKPIEGDAEFLLRYAEVTLESSLNRQLATAVWPRIARFEDCKPLQRWAAKDLLSAMYWMFALDMTRIPPRQCANIACRRFFLPSRQKQEYCSPGCQAAQKSRRYRQRRR